MKITFVYLNDWEGMYIDGNLAFQGHSLSAEEALRLLSKFVMPLTIEQVDGDNDHYEDLGVLPSLLENVKTQ